MNTTTADQGRCVRLAELALEIAALRGKIRRTFQDEELLSRIGRGSEVRLGQIADERGRLEDALSNLVKDQDEPTRL
jgi:hypothetical protein